MVFKSSSKRRNSSLANPNGSQRSFPNRSLSGRRSQTSITQAKGHVQSRPRKRVTLHPPTSRANSTSPIHSSASVASSARVDSAARLDPTNRPENDAAIDEREDNDALNEVVMALDFRDRGTVGCCYYIAKEEKLYFMDDMKFGGMDVINLCMPPHWYSLVLSY